MPVTREAQSQRALLARDNSGRLIAVDATGAAASDGLRQRGSPYLKIVLFYPLYFWAVSSSRRWWWRTASSSASFWRVRRSASGVIDLVQLGFGQQPT